MMMMMMMTAAATTMMMTTRTKTMMTNLEHKPLETCLLAHPMCRCAD